MLPACALCRTWCLLAGCSQFGGLEGLKKAFIEQSYKIFGSGYVTLVKEDHSGDLAVIANGVSDREQAG